MRHGRNISTRQTRMRGTASGMRHGYKEERILVGCEDVSCCALSLSFFIPSLIILDLLVKKQQSYPGKGQSPPFSLRGALIPSCFVGSPPLMNQSDPGLQKSVRQCH
jgi:hypothetical protein